MKKFKKMFGGKKDIDHRRDDSGTPSLRTRHSIADGLSSLDRSMPQVARPSPESNPIPRPVASTGYLPLFGDPASRQSSLATERQTGSARGPTVIQGPGARFPPLPDSTSTVRETAEPAVKSPSLLASERKQNTPIKRRNVGAAPTSERFSSASKSQDRPRNSRDSGSTISIGKDESPDSDSDLDLDDLIAMMMVSRHGSRPSGRTSPDISGSLEALLFAAMLSKARNATEEEKSSTEGKKSTAEEKGSPATHSRPTIQKPAIGQKSGPADSSTSSQAKPSQPAAKKSAWPPPASAPKFKVPVLAAQKEGIAAPSPPPAESSMTQPKKELTPSPPPQEPISTRRIAQPRRSLINRTADSDGHTSSRPTTSTSTSTATSRPPLKPPTSTTTTTTTKTTTVSSPPAAKPVTPKSTEYDPSPTPESIASARKLHEQRVARLRATAAATRREDSARWPPRPATATATTTATGTGTNTSTNAGANAGVSSSSSNRNTPASRTVRSFMSPPPPQPGPFPLLAKEKEKEKKRQLLVRSVEPPRFRVPVLSEGERAAAAAGGLRTRTMVAGAAGVGARTSSRGWEGWD